MMNKRNIATNPCGRGSLFQPVWIYEGAENTQHSILGLLEFSAPQEINLHFQSCGMFVRLKMLLEYSTVF